MSASEISAVNETLISAVAAGDAATAAACYTREGCFIAPNSDFIKGPEQIKEFFASIFEMGIKELKLATIELEMHGDTAIEVGTYELLVDGGVQADHGKFVVIWKNEDGNWKLHRDMINTSLPAPE
jgi:uncharacterized protein (TIGR02246 family)